MTSIKELIDHTIDEGNRLFDETRFKDTWMIYHDSLLQYWEKGVQDHIEGCGFKHRQWRDWGKTNEEIAPHYNNQLMGDIPKLMSLDRSVFGSLIERVVWLVVLTSIGIIYIQWRHQIRLG